MEEGEEERFKWRVGHESGVEDECEGGVMGWCLEIRDGSCYA